MNTEFFDSFDFGMSESDQSFAEPFIYPSGSLNVYHGTYNGSTFEVENGRGGFLNQTNGCLVVRKCVLPISPAIGDLITKDGTPLRVVSVQNETTTYTINLTGISGKK